MIVLDASAAVELILRRGAYEQIAEVALAPGQLLHAPHLIDVEVAQVLRRLHLARALDDERATEALGDLTDLRLVRHGHTPLLSRVWGLRHNLTAYDALYVALAEALEAPLLTMDSALAAAFTSARVILVRSGGD